MRHTSINKKPISAITTNELLEQNNLVNKDQNFTKKRLIRIQKFCEGDKVYIKNERKIDKLDVNFLGPYVIAECLDNNSYMVNIDGKKIKKNHQQIKLFECVDSLGGVVI